MLMTCGFDIRDDGTFVITSHYPFLGDNDQPFVAVAPDELRKHILDAARDEANFRPQPDRPEFTMLCVGPLLYLYGSDLTWHTLEQIIA